VSQQACPDGHCTSTGRARQLSQPPILLHDEHRVGRARVRKAPENYCRSLTDDRSVLLDRYRFEDVAIKVVGIGSVGHTLLRRVALPGG